MTQLVCLIHQADVLKFNSHRAPCRTDTAPLKGAPKYLPITLSILSHSHSDPYLSLRSKECLSSSAIPFALSFSGLRTSALERPEARKS